MKSFSGSSHQSCNKLPRFHSGSNSLSDPMLGVTFIELMITLAIVALLIGLSAPGLQQIVSRSQSDSLQELLRAAIYRTRSAAVYSKKITTLCPYGKNSCGADWNHGAMIFTDANNNGIIDDEDRLLEKINWPARQLTISWRASGRKNYLRYSPTGMARQFGRFVICSRSNDLSLARSIVINRQGRLRLYTDKNSDGIVEDIDGKQPACQSG